MKTVIIFRRDQIAADNAAMQRALALHDAINQLRRAGSCVLAASDVEQDDPALQGIHTRLLSLLGELQKLE